LPAPRSPEIRNTRVRGQASPVQNNRTRTPEPATRTRWVVYVSN
jgi:hypothetical protein